LSSWSVQLLTEQKIILQEGTIVAFVSSLSHLHSGLWSGARGFHATVVSSGLAGLQGMQRLDFSN